MAIITASTFDPLLAHVNVRLQQGVPIVDADWNLLDDIRKFELRAFLKWFVGDGVPDGNDGFRVTGGPENSFTIRAGAQGPTGQLPSQEAALRQVGRFLVDGLDVFLPADLAFNAQPLHETQPGAAALAARFGVPMVAKLVTPTVDDQVVVELDVWERLLTPDEDPDLIHVGLGVETCARTRREWVVRAYPTGVTPGRLTGHSYATLAVLRRFAGKSAVADGDVVDQRQRRLLLPPANLVSDVFGLDPYEYRAGLGRPPISLREAINALLAGRLPTTDDLPVAPAQGTDLLRRAVVLDPQNGLSVFWISPRNGTGVGPNQVVGARLDLAKPGAQFGPAVALTSGAQHTEPTAVALPNGEYLVAYQNGAGSVDTTDVVLKRAAFAGLAAAPESTLFGTAGEADERPFAALTGDVVTFFARQAKTSAWRFRRYRHTDNTFLDDLPVGLPAPAGLGSAGSLHASAAGGVVWFAYPNSDDATMTLARLDPAAAAGSAVSQIIPAPLPGVDPFVVGISATEALVFYQDGGQLKMINAQGGGWPLGTITPIPLSAGESQVAVARDAGGTLFLLSVRNLAVGGNEVFLRRRDPSTGGWGTAQQVIANPANDQNPYPVLVQGQGIWVLWRSTRNGDFDVFAKRIVTAI
jgi:hypothetical protein